MKFRFLMLVIATTLGHVQVHAQTIEAFTEPHRRIAVPASEMGIIEVLNVREGDVVHSSQVLGKLDDRVLVASLDVAESAVRATGARLNAEADQKIRQEQLEGYQSLARDGNATNRELRQAELEVQQAAARLQSVDEDLEVRRLECERIKTQIQQRQIVSPINGIVVAIQKNAGEFVSPTDPTVMILVQLDSLLAVFSVPRIAASKMKVGDEASLALGLQEGKAIGVIEFVSPVATPESNTVQVKVRIPNYDHKIPSGVSCRWELSAPSSASPLPITRTSREAKPATKQR